MPIYDYVCANCGERTEVMHAVDASGPSECQACGGPMRKALSAPAIVFKGSGWAKKDARSAASMGAGDSKSRQAEGGSTEGGTDSAAKSDTTAKKEASAAAD